MTNGKIREAVQRDHELLTHISFQSKQYWNYPLEYFDTWQNELTITEDYIADNIVFVVEANNTVIGYYSLVNLEQKITISGITLDKGYWLEHMFLLPEFIKQGFGSKMIAHFKTFCLDNGISKVHLLSDPNARAFYEKCGFNYIKEYPSSIPGRTTPLLEMKMNGE